MKKIHILKTGTFTPKQGGKVSFSEEILSSIASNYDPAKYEAPLVIGHPSQEDRAWGWVEAIEETDNGIYAIPKQVNASFNELVEEGAYKKVSVELYTPNAKNNPNHGEYSLKHIGFLGAQPPAVKGLDPISFSEDEDGETVSISFSEENQKSVNPQGILESIKKLLLGTEVSSEESSFSEEDDQDDPGSDDQDQTDPTTDTTNEPDMNKEQIAADKAALEADRASFAEEQRAFREEKISAEIDDLIAEGKIAPGQKDLYVSFASSLDDKEDVVSFGEGDEKLSLSATFNQILTQLPKQISFGEASEEDGSGDDLDLDDAEAVARKAISLQQERAKEGETISISAAVNAVSKGE